MPSNYQYTAADIKKCLGSIENSEWATQRKFQEDIADYAWHRLNRRLQGWMLHKGAWIDDKTDEKKVEEAFTAFEKKNLRSYGRWKSLTKVDGGFDERDHNDSLEERMKRLYLFYLTYAEIQDFRGQKAVLYLFYHVVLDRYKSGDMELASYIREQGHKLYRFMSLMYSKDEMNQECFHHDDLDDLCNSSSFVKKFWEKKDFLISFGLTPDSTKPSFPYSTKLLNLETPVFVKYWVKVAQDTVNAENREQRERWITDNFLEAKDLEEVKAMANDYNTKMEEANNAEKKKGHSEQRFEAKSDRWKPSEEDYDDKPDVIHSFRMAYTQFETAKEMILSAEKAEAEAMKTIDVSQQKNFRDRKGAETAYTAAKKVLISAERDFEEAKKGFERAAEGFTTIQDCQSYSMEALYQKDRAEWRQKVIAASLVKLQMVQKIQFTYEDQLNKERIKFAKKWKTFFEKSGGPLGWFGYLTVVYHYRDVVYLHLFVLLPLIWLYFSYQDYITLANIGGDVSALVSMDTISDPNRNLILPFGAIIAILVIMIILFNVWLRWRTRGKSAPGRGSKTPKLVNFVARVRCFFLWFFTIITEVVILNYLIVVPIKAATEDFVSTWDPIKSPILLIIFWLPTVVLYFSSLQFIHTLWIGIFGFFYGITDRVHNTITWNAMIQLFQKVGSSTKVEDKFVTVPLVVELFCKYTLSSDAKIEDPVRRQVAFARVWNAILNSFFESHKLSKEELGRYSYKIKKTSPEDFLAGIIEKEPDFSKEPKVKEVRYHLIRFVNNLNMKSKPHNNTSVRAMLPLTIVTPVGNEKILYPYEFVTHVDNTQSSFLQHLITGEPYEWIYFKSKECQSEKAKDWVERMEKDILQGVQPDQEKKGKKRWIHDTTEGQALKRKICEWASLRFQALFRTIYGFMQIPMALECLARIENPKMTQAEAEQLVREKFSYIIGYQSYASAHKKFKDSKGKAKAGQDLTAQEMDAHDVVYNIKYIKARFPEVKIAYVDYVNEKYIGKMGSGLNKASSNFYDFSIEMFGPFADLGLGKPTHQNFLSQFIDGMMIQTIDVNQDNVMSQSFFVPNVLAEFDRDKSIKIVGCPEFVITTNWSSTAWCSAFSEHTFGTLVQRCYSKLGIRLHYGHPDFLDALFVMCDSGMSKMPYVSEDIFTGFDAVIKGGRILHIEYHEVGKARDVDLYTTTKFQRKISMGASQMACSRYINQLQSSINVSFFQGLSYYYSTVGFYVNHLILYLSIWFALVGQLILIIIQKAVLHEEISNFITTRIFLFQIGFALMAPGILQLWLEMGFFAGTWNFLSHVLILAVYSTFHILNISSYWQWGLQHSAFYLASGRGTGLEHYFMRDMYDNFYKTHWRAGFIIFWLGIIALAVGGSIWVFLIMYLLPSGIWLWGAMFLNPGSLPSTVHEEQWKRLINRDMQEARDIVRHHVGLDHHRKPITGNVFKRFFKHIARGVRRFFQGLHWVYTIVNFAIQMRIVRLIAIFTLGWEYIFAEKIPTFIFTDERRRVLRWDEEENRQKSLFFSSLTSHSSSEIEDLRNSPNNSSLRRSVRTAEQRLSISSDGESRPLPAPPPKKTLGSRKRSVRFLVNRPPGGENGSTDEMVSSEENRGLPVPPQLPPKKGATRPSRSSGRDLKAAR